MKLPKVTFGIVNCNRLHYLKASLESLLLCTADYTNKEIMIIDNASIEKNTSEYLDEKEKQGIKIFRRKERDPANEFSIALNTIVENSTGKYVCLLQGDTQFVIKGGWLKEYVTYFEKYGEFIGGITFDAQRRVRLDSSKFYAFNEKDFKTKFPIAVDINRNPVSGAGKTMYSKSLLEKIYPWPTTSNNQTIADATGGSEDIIRKRVNNLIANNEIVKPYACMPKFPVSISIYTDIRGTNARIRGNRLYGDYWPGKINNMYYEIFEYEDITSNNKFKNKIISIEDIAKPLGDWKLPLDPNGNWKKNSIKMSSEKEDDFIDLDKLQ